MFEDTESSSSTGSDVPELAPLAFQSFVLPQEQNSTLQKAVKGLIDIDKKRILLIMDHESVRKTTEYIVQFTVGNDVIVVPQNNTKIDITDEKFILTRDGETVVYTVEYVIQSEGLLLHKDGLQFTSFAFFRKDNPVLTKDITGIIDTAQHRIVLPVPHSVLTKTTQLVPAFTVPKGVEVTPKVKVLQDFKVPITYNLSKENDSISYTTDIVVIKDSIPKIQDKSIISFTRFTFEKSKNAHITEATDIEGIIDTTNKKILLIVSQVTFDANSVFTPTFVLPSNMVSNKKNNTPQNFSQPVLYTLTQNNNSVAYSVEVVISAPSVVRSNIATFETFRFLKKNNVHMGEQELSDAIGIVDTTRKKVTLIVQSDTFATSPVFTPTFTLPKGVTSNIASGTAKDFTHPVFYTLTKNGVDHIYEVQVVIQSRSVTAKQPYINSFIFEKKNNAHIVESEDIEGIINSITNEIVLLVKQATVSTSKEFVPTITTVHGGTLTPDTGLKRDFGKPIFYTLKKGDYSQSYKVSTRIAEDIPSSIDSTVIQTFEFEVAKNPVLPLAYKGVVDQKTNTITIALPTSIYNKVYDSTKKELALIPTLLGNYKTLVPDLTKGLTLDENQSQQIIITDFDGNTKTYTVQITLIKSNEAQIQSFVLEKTKNSHMKEEVSDVQGIVDHTKGIITFAVRYNTYQASTIFIPTITLSDGASVTPIAVTPIDVSKDIQYTVTSESGTYTKTYTVTVTTTYDSIAKIKSLYFSHFKPTSLSSSIDVSHFNKIIKKKDTNNYELYLLPAEYKYFIAKPLRFTFETIAEGSVDNAHKYATIPHTFTVRSKDSIGTNQVTVTPKKLPMPNKICLDIYDDGTLPSGYTAKYKKRVKGGCKYIPAYDIERKRIDTYVLVTQYRESDTFRAFVQSTDLKLYFDTDAIESYTFTKEATRPSTFTATRSGDMLNIAVDYNDFHTTTENTSTVKLGTLAIQNNGYTIQFDIYVSHLVRLMKSWKFWGTTIYSAGEDPFRNYLRDADYTDMLQDTFVSSVHYSTDSVTDERTATVTITALQDIQSYTDTALINTTQNMSDMYIHQEVFTRLKLISLCYADDDDSDNDAIQYQAKYTVNRTNVQHTIQKNLYQKFRNKYSNMRFDYSGNVIWYSYAYIFDLGLDTYTSPPFCLVQRNGLSKENIYSIPTVHPTQKISGGKNMNNFIRDIIENHSAVTYPKILGDNATIVVVADRSVEVDILFKNK